MELGKKLKKMRDLRGYTQEELSDISHVPISAISRIENGRNLNPGINTVSKLAEALRVELNYFNLDHARTHFDIADNEISQQVREILLNKNMMPYLLLGAKAYEQQIPPEIIKKLIETITEARIT